MLFLPRKQLHSVLQTAVVSPDAISHVVSLDCSLLLSSRQHTSQHIELFFPCAQLQRLLACGSECSVDTKPQTQNQCPKVNHPLDVLSQPHSKNNRPLPATLYTYLPSLLVLRGAKLLLLPILQLVNRTRGATGNLLNTRLD